ncbi:TraR/DksA family transcriptional regulator, partial [Neobacillus fumarioli]
MFPSFYNLFDIVFRGTYGKCVDTGEDIPHGRLEIFPYTKRTQEAQKKFE